MKVAILSGVACLVVPMLSGCGAGALTPAGEKVKLMKADPPANCAEVKSVTVTPIGFCTVDCQKVKMRNEAGEAGANYLRYETYSNDAGSSGTAFKCP